MKERRRGGRGRDGGMIEKRKGRKAKGSRRRVGEVRGGVGRERRKMERREEWEGERWKREDREKTGRKVHLAGQKTAKNVKPIYPYPVGWVPSSRSESVLPYC